MANNSDNFEDDETQKKDETTGAENQEPQENIPQSDSEKHNPYLANKEIKILKIIGIVLLVIIGIPLVVFGVCILMFNLNF